MIQSIIQIQTELLQLPQFLHNFVNTVSLAITIAQHIRYELTVIQEIHTLIFVLLAYHTVTFAQYECVWPLIMTLFIFKFHEGRHVCECKCACRVVGERKAVRYDCFAVCTLEDEGVLKGVVAFHGVRKIEGHIKES